MKTSLVGGSMRHLASLVMLAMAQEVMPPLVARTETSAPGRASKAKASHKQNARKAAKKRRG